jgi:DtxR family Mn-dependent transcriptional regulator
MARMLPWSKLHEEAHNLEHAISAQVESALFEDLGHPQTCPHGNPLPGCDEAVADWVPLTDLLPNQSVIIRRVHELAEYNPQLLDFLEHKGITPGAEVTVREVLPFNQSIAMDVSGQAVTLGFASARYLFVETQPEIS